MADPFDAPGLTAPALDARVDITDHYVFQRPGDPDRTILILDVNPLAPAHANEFRHDAVYETLVDTNADAKPDIAFRYRFTPKQDGRQFARVTRIELHRDLEDGHLEGEDAAEPLFEHAPVSFGPEPLITRGDDDMQFFAGLRSDPFFFDLLGFLNGLKFTGSDFFIDKNVFGIALDIPTRLLGSRSSIGLWTRTLVPMTLQPGHFTQFDRIGRPAKLEAFGGYPAAPQALGSEDVLSFDYSSAAGYLNGRRLQDDVIDLSLSLMTSGQITGDGVGPHGDYLSEFPYLGQPHP
jgi:hypothetical protein